MVERAVILARGGAVQFDVTPPPGERRDPVEAGRSYRTEEEWRRLERENLLAALEASGGRVAGPRGAAALLGINANTLTSRLRPWTAEDVHKLIRPSRDTRFDFVITLPLSSVIRGGPMNRRQALKSIGVAAGLPLSSREIFAFGRAAHAHVQAAVSGDRYIFQSLDTQQCEILSAATELIIPETDTPGARAARVPEFIDTVLTGWFHEDERRRFLRGIRELDERARTSGAAGFAACQSPVQTRILRDMESEALQELEGVAPTRVARRAALSSPGAPFFSVLKWLTVFGYYTSAAGMDKELEFVEFPGTYDGCAPLRGR